MPYISEDDRDGLDRGNVALSVGELTYALQQQIERFLLARPAEQGIRYRDLAEVLGALEGCKADFIDRILLPYEATKCAENGDVWDSRLIATNR